MWFKIMVGVFFLMYFYNKCKIKRMLLLSDQLKSSFWSIPLIGHAYLLVGNSEKLMNLLMKLGKDAIKYGGITKFWIMNKLYVVLTDAADLEMVLFKCLEKDDIVEGVKFILGDCTIIAPVPIWRRRRKLIMSSFNKRALIEHTPIFAKRSEILVQQIAKYEGKNSFSILQYIEKYTLDSVCEAILGVQMEYQRGDIHPLLDALKKTCELGAKRVYQPWRKIEAISKLIGDHDKAIQYKKQMSETVENIISAKRGELSAEINNESNSNTISRKCFLDMHIDTKKDLNTLSDHELSEESLLLILAGTDTSAIGASFTLLLLARHMDIQEKVFEELNLVLGSVVYDVKAKQVTKLYYLERVIKESLRLYPPGPVIFRKVTKELVLDSGIKLVPNTGVVINIWAANRNPRYWGEDADEFKPERHAVPKDPASYMSFSYGSRNCPGQEYAMIVMKIVLANILRRYRVLPSESKQIEPRFGDDLSPDEQTTLGHSRPKDLSSEVSQDQKEIDQNLTHVSKKESIRLRYDVLLKDVDNFHIRLVPRL